jgi:hypothetical protein
VWLPVRACVIQSRDYCLALPRAYTHADVCYTLLTNAPLAYGVTVLFQLCNGDAGALEL